MKVKIKLAEGAILPYYSKEGDAGLDLTAISLKEDEHGNFVYDTGISVEIPEGFVGLLFPRSSNSKMGLYLTNHVGVVDSGYRGNILLKYRRIEQGGKCAKVYSVGDRVAQLIIIPIPKIEFEEVSELSTTERGEGGFGSTGTVTYNNSVSSTLTNTI